MYNRRTIIKNGVGSVLGMVLVAAGFKGQAQAESISDRIVILPEAGPEKIVAPLYNGNRWYGDDGTLFGVEALTSYSTEISYLYKAYPMWKQHEEAFQGNLRQWDESYNYVPYYWQVDIPKDTLANVGTENVNDILRSYEQDFESSFYDAVKDGYLTEPQVFGTLFTAPKERESGLGSGPGWGTAKEYNWWSRQREAARAARDEELREYRKPLWGAELGGSSD